MTRAFLQSLPPSSTGDDLRARETIAARGMKFVVLEVAPLQWPPLQWGPD